MSDDLNWLTVPSWDKLLKDPYGFYENVKKAQQKLKQHSGTQLASTMLTEKALRAARDQMMICYGTSRVRDCLTTYLQAFPDDADIRQWWQEGLLLEMVRFMGQFEFSHTNILI